MTKIINDVQNIVRHMLHGFYFEHKDRVSYNAKHNLIFRKDLADMGRQVVLISGGGSGHEPADFGYVGDGMLSVAVVGEIFVPPTPEQVLEAIRLVDRSRSVLLIIKNFTADVGNFLTAEAWAKEEGRMVDHVIVNDDVSIEDDVTYNKRRRGVAGTVLVHKILGAAAREGYTLEQLKELGEQVTGRLHTLGVALSPANDPTKGEPSFTLQTNEAYYGVGIHGEKGYRKEVFSSSEKLAVELFNKLKSVYRWRRQDPFAILVNGLGATPLVEQYAFANDIRRLCELENLDVRFVKVGTHLTSLDMEGISLSFLKIEDPKWEAWLKADVEAAKW
ncbi:DhaKLM operon coactivator DhaQ [Paenibacillus oleatilyticus]|uniref:DhaKLM operon coactivator DhaQ n=1 Tax=Paenibacillus oleatilyticus TaxID=2594886 RepID=UPI001C1FE18D|nr:DhaKLM operon coactivator DhaQ [Paenibacillus oleatilyticus]MBU7315728.1 DhaKLM operon coactivator DhaQ [Paenibacillus oleatilyticus]